MKVKVMNDFILVEPFEIEPLGYSSIIHLPDISKLNDGDRPHKGKVVGMGSKAFKEEVKIGDIIRFSKWGGQKVMIDNKKYVFVTYEDLLTVDND